MPPQEHIQSTQSECGERPPAVTPSVEEILAQFHTPPAHRASGKETGYGGDSDGTDEVLLTRSPFALRRRAVLRLLPFDSPWDGDPLARQESVYVRPASLPPTDETGDCSDFGAAVVSVRRSPGPYAKLTYILSENAVAFTALIATLDRNGFTAVSPNRALLDSTWSLKWVKRPPRSEFVKVRAYQKLNHIPGTWRIGRKDELHTHMRRAEARWSEYHRRRKQHNGDNDDGDGSVADVGTGDSTARSAPLFSPSGSGGYVFPEAWVLPSDLVSCEGALRSPQNAGELFIYKPTNSAGGVGVKLLRAGPAACAPASPTRTQPTRPRGSTVAKVDEWGDVRERPHGVLQRYVADPYLIGGRKFDLRLYVVVTSYAPLRVYLYTEGLVRFASAPYHSHGGSSLAPVTQLEAHLTNFTVNKAAEGVAEAKWPLAALRAHVRSEGLDWDGTQSRIDDLLAKVFLSILPEVREELYDIDESQREGRGTAGGTAAADARLQPPCTFKGVSPFFEIYGVDVLLRAPGHDDKTLSPVLMEVNVMPSLSTHYSPLDQRIKANFVADALTLVGLTSMAIKVSSRPTLCPGAGQQQQQGGSAYGNVFLDSLSDVALLEACLTAEEELHRAQNFSRILPTSRSMDDYAALYRHHEGSVTRCSASDVDTVLSAWERYKVEALS